MRIRLGYELTYECPQPVPAIAMLNVHHSRVQDLESPDHLITDPPIATSGYRDAFGNWCTRLVLPAGRTRLTADTVIRDSGEPEAVAPDADQRPVAELPAETLVYLLGSRYCETDRLMNVAWSLFGAVEPGWSRVQAICDFVHDHVTFGYAFARPTKSASETYEEERGVCRDFAHLALTFCRCMNIPARYCTGYLGDIGVPPVDYPMDFSGWFEAYLDGRWYTFDARHNVPRIGRVLMARGRDAADVPLTTTFGPNWLASFKVWTDEIVESDAEPLAVEASES